MAFRRLTENIEHLLPQFADVAGKYDIPVIEPVELPFLDEWVPFNDLSKPFTKSQGVHMFVDDYRMVRCWNNPSRYLEVLQRAGVVLTPDYSLYTDTPIALNLYNHYRKHWLGQYWQKNGIKVIPTICWADEKSYEWCFDGEPSKSVVAVSSVGTQKDTDAKRLFVNGYDAMLERLQPETILFWGHIPAECRGNICPVETFYRRFEKAREAKNHAEA